MRILMIFILILINIYAFYEGMYYTSIQLQADDNLNQNQVVIKKVDKDLIFDKISKISRKLDNNVRNIFSEVQISSPIADAKKINVVSDDIDKIRLVGIIVPIDEVLHKTAIIEYGTPLRTLRLHKGDLIPGTNWRIKIVGDREIIIENNTIESKMNFR